jgi:hypothetical protein
VLSGTLYAAAARRWLNDASDFIAWIARVILSVQDSNSRSGSGGIVSGGRKRCGLGKVRHSGGVRHSVSGYVMQAEKQSYLAAYDARWSKDAFIEECNSAGVTPATDFGIFYL